MIELNELDNLILKLLNYLGSIQNDDGSFERMQSNQLYKWETDIKNSAFDTAVPLVPLCFMKAQKATSIMQKGMRYILKSSNIDNFIWTWPSSTSNPIPFCTDDTSICSYVLEKNGVKIKNKEFLNEFIDENHHYRFYILPDKKYKSISFSTYLKLIWHNKGIKKSKYFKDDVIRIDDNEFTSSCINLLYINKTESNKIVWKKIKEQFESKEIDYIYYIDIYHAFYAYARLLAYENHEDLMPSSAILNSYIIELFSGLDDVSNSPRHVLLMNSLLFFKVNLNQYSSLTESCINIIRKELYTSSTVYYSSHNKFCLSPGVDESGDFVFFGSSAITCSLYLEFLNLYRKHYFGSYFEEK